MNVRVLAAAAVAATVLFTSGLPADAGHRHRHWFYGSYGAYDRGAVVDFGFWGGPWPWAPPAMPPRAYAAYPPAGPGPQPITPEFYYEVAPGEFVPVYGKDHAGPAPMPERDGTAPGYRPEARVPQQQPRRPLALVPVPKPKPALAQQLAASAPAATIVETDEPAAKSVGPAISCARAQQIVGDFGFTDIQTLGCAGKEYGFRARRDGKDFEVRLSSLSGELIEVKRR